MNKILILLLSLALGVLILLFAGLPTRWAVSYNLALFIIILSITLNNPKRFFLFLFFLSLPIITRNFIGQLSRLHFGGPSGFYFTLNDFLLIMLYFIWILEIFIAKNFSFRFSKLDLLILGIIFLSFLSMHNAIDKSLCLYEIFRLIIMYLIFFYMENNITTMRDLQLICVSLMIGLFLESLLGLFQYYGGQTFGLALIGEREEMVSFEGISRIVGTFGHPNGFARYLGFFISIPFCLLLSPIKVRYKIFCAVIFLVAFSALVLTLSRIAWGSFIFSMFILLLLGFKAGFISPRRVLSIMAAGVLFLMLVTFSFQDLIFTRLFSDDYGSAQSRIPLMKVAMNIIKTHPLLGIGINNYAEVMRRYDNTSEMISLSNPDLIVHNSYLLIACEVGIAGLFLLLCFIMHICKQTLMIIYCNDRFVICITLGIIAGLTSFWAQLLVMPDTMVSNGYLFFWSTSGVVAALSYLPLKVLK